MTELWRHIYYPTWRSRHQNFIFGFVLVFSLLQEYRNLPADQTLAKYLNPRLTYYYFRSLKTHVCHVGILLPVVIFTFVSSSACHFASGYQTAFKTDHPRWNYDVVAIFKVAVVIHIEFSARSSNFVSIGFTVSEIFTFNVVLIILWHRAKV